MPAQVLYHLRFFAKLDLWLLTRKQRLWQLNEKKVDKFLRRLRAKHPTYAKTKDVLILPQSGTGPSLLILRGRFFIRRRPV